MNIKLNHLSLLILFLTIFTLFKPTHASIKVYGDFPITGTPDVVRFEPIFQAKDIQNGKNKPYLSYDLVFKGGMNKTVFFVAGIREEVLKTLECMNGVLIDNNNEKSKKNHVIVRVLMEKPIENIRGKMGIFKTGIYTSYFVSCSQLSKQENLAAFFHMMSNSLTNTTSAEISPSLPFVQVSGQVIYANPFGLLPAHKYPYIRFYFFMIIISVLCFAFWVYRIYLFPKEIFYYHHCITCILVATCFEMLFHEIDLLSFNRTGFRSTSFYLIGKFFTVLKKAFGRLIILNLCAGVGIIIPSLKHKNKQLAFYGLCAFYFLADLIYQMRSGFIIDIQEENDLLLAIFHLILVILDSIIFIIIYYELYTTFSSLTENEAYKKALYTKFAFLLLVTCVATLIFSVIQVNYVRNKEWIKNSGWQSYWFIEDGYWTIQFFIVLIFIMISWLPSEDSSRYMYCEQIPFEENKCVEPEHDKNDKFEALIMNSDSEVSDDNGKFTIDNENDNAEEEEEEEEKKEKKEEYVDEDDQNEEEEHDDNEEDEGNEEEEENEVEEVKEKTKISKNSDDFVVEIDQILEKNTKSGNKSDETNDNEVNMDLGNGDKPELKKQERN